MFGILNKSEYKLENIVKQNRKNPRSFLKPSDDEIEALKVGDTVKLIFIMSHPQENGCHAERMWVVITKISNGVFCGELDNAPCFLTSIQAGDEIEFSKKNIATILLHKMECFDDKKFAIITKRAIKKKEINYIFRTDDIDNEKDSGWQLFYGDEDDTYLSNSDNSTVIRLEDVLGFEPLLEKPFSENETHYRYSKTENGFIYIDDDHFE